MNFVQQYYAFKHKWYYKIGSILFDFYLNKEPNNKLEKIKYEYLEDLILTYLNKEEIDEEKISSELKFLNLEALNKLELEIVKYVIQVSEKYEEVKFRATDYVYFAMLLEITIVLYNGAFTGISEKQIYNILKENLFRFEFIDFKRKQSKVNLLIKYLKYINKNESYYFSNLKNKNVDINVTVLSNHNNYFIIDIKNKLTDLVKYDEELVESVEKNNDYLNKLFILNFNLLIEEIIFLLEKEKFTINKIIFNLDDYKFSRNVLNYINNYDSTINKYIMLCSSDKKKLDLISNNYDKCIFIKDNKMDKVSNYKGMNVLVKKSFWKNHKIDSLKYKDLNFITISDNIIYKFLKEAK